MTAPRRVPIHRSLAQPPMLFGCDRNWLLFTMALDAAFFVGGIGRASTELILFAAFFLVAGVSFLVSLGKRDQRFIEVFRRSRGYANQYSATGRWDVSPRKPKRW